jgi:hypothetical protein
MAAIDYERKVREYANQTGPVRKGIGVAAFWYNTAVYPISLETSSCRMQLNLDGTVTVQVGETEIGQGADGFFRSGTFDFAGDNRVAFRGFGGLFSRKAAHAHTRRGQQARATVGTGVVKVFRRRGFFSRVVDRGQDAAVRLQVAVGFLVGADAVRRGFSSMTRPSIRSSPSRSGAPTAAEIAAPVRRTASSSRSCSPRAHRAGESARPALIPQNVN